MMLWSFACSSHELMGFLVMGKAPKVVSDSQAVSYALILELLPYEQVALDHGLALHMRLLMTAS